MVTFMCYHCDRTLTKPQVDKHVKTQCRKPPQLICIDCKKMFGDNHTEHISCLTEKQLYWGQYANGKNPQKQQPKVQPAPPPSEETNGTKSEWKGWRKSIDQFVKQSENKEIRLNEVKEGVISQFLSIYPEYTKQEAEEQFNDAIKQSKKYEIEFVGFIVKKVKVEG